MSGISHNEQFRIESEALLSDAASTSHALFGNFVLPKNESEAEQVAFLRSMNTIEVYRRQGIDDKPTLELVCTYHLPNARCLAMQKVTIDVR